jgi:homoserine O-acetyltransferase
MVALQFAALFPDRVGKVLAFCAGHRASSMASGWRHVQRQVLDFGISNGDHKTAVRIARSLAMCTYRSEREFSRRFRGNSPVAYLDHCGEAFSEQFNIYAYRCLSQSIDDHRLDPAEIGIPVDLAGFTTDQIVPPQQLLELRRRLGGAGSLKLLDSPYGHDAFLKERGTVSAIIRRHLEGRT